MKNLKLELNIKDLLEKILSIDKKLVSLPTEIININLKNKDYGNEKF